MSPNGDLEAAIGFVTARIAKEAEVSGTSLSDHQREVLRNLPTGVSHFQVLENMRPIPRNWELERVLELCKIAYRSDRDRDAHSRNWEFALGVFALNNHPMRGLLEMAGGEAAKAEVGPAVAGRRRFAPIGGCVGDCLERGRACTSFG